MDQFLFWLALVGWGIVIMQNLSTVKKIYDYVRDFFPGQKRRYSRKLR